MLGIEDVKPTAWSVNRNKNALCCKLVEFLSGLTPWFMRVVHFCSLFDAHFELSQAGYLTNQNISRHHGCHTFGCARVNQIARLQFPGG